MKTLTITRPDDWHVHLRDDGALAAVAPHTARHFARALVMPNLRPPVTRISDALEYRQRILDALPDNRQFQPLMTLYLTDATTRETLAEAAAHPDILACKLYPAGATTHSDAGIRDVGSIHTLLETMEKLDLPLLVHGEVTSTEVDIFDREARFIDEFLAPISLRFPGLRIVLEHITTREGIAFVQSARDGIAGTLTPHHLLYNRNHMLAGGIRPHYYCLPILKREDHRQALLAAATSGNPRFFLGTDSAPHARHTKEATCGCAGCFTAPHAMALYATAFDAVNALDRLEGFASHHGADFYRLPRNTTSLTLTQTPQTLPDAYPYGADSLIPLNAGETLPWSIMDASPDQDA